MKKITFVVLFCFAQTFISAQKAISLTRAEQNLAVSLGFDTQILLMIKSVVDNPIEHFFVAEAPKYVGDSIVGWEDKLVNGVTMFLSEGQADTMLFQLTDVLWEKGYHIFRTEDNFGNKPDQVGVLKTNDPMDALRAMGTDGINYGLNNRQLINWLQDLNMRYPFHICGAGPDWVEGVLMVPDADYKTLSQELVRNCPGLLEEGVATMDDLIKYIEENGMFYLWWD